VANSEITERLGVSRPTVIAWRKHYTREGSPRAVATAWALERPAVAAGRGSPGEVVQLPGGTVSLQAAIDWIAAMVLGTVCWASPWWQPERVTRAGHP
jgi:hypothetical protein